MASTRQTSTAVARDGSPSGLEHRIEEYVDRTECTLFPRDADEDAVVTQWITASDGAYVDLADAR